MQVDHDFVFVIGTGFEATLWHPTAKYVCDQDDSKKLREEQISPIAFIQL
jgi:hypothetical protein